MKNETLVTSTLVPTDQRTLVTAKLFGHLFPTRIEPTVFNMAQYLSKDYTGGYWEFYTLSNGGFHMTPATEDLFHVETSSNFFEGDMDAAAFGITACLYAYSHLAFANEPELAGVCSEHYHLLRDFALDHEEAEAIMRAID